jgi:hypothetical protein
LIEHPGKDPKNIVYSKWDYAAVSGTFEENYWMWGCTWWMPVGTTTEESREKDYPCWDDYQYWNDQFSRSTYSSKGLGLPW